MWAAPGMNNPADPDSPTGSREDADPEQVAAAAARDHRDQHEAQGIAHKRSFFCLAHAFFAPLLPNAFGMVALSMSGESMLPMIIEYETPSAPVPKIRKRPVSMPIISA